MQPKVATLAYSRIVKRPVAAWPNGSKIEAAFKKGVLTIQLPKTQEAQEKVKHIDVKAA